jgi:hypothetical protein
LLAGHSGVEFSRSETVVMRSAQSTSAADDEGGQVGGVNAGQGVTDK